MTGLLVFLGLLGTFWGLLGTINAVASVISTLEVEQGDFASVFADLKRGLIEPLAGMGTAFSSSLFGLAGALVLGFLDIQAGHAQNRFYDGLEEWLSGVTQFIDASEKSPHDEPTTLRLDPDYVIKMIEELREENRQIKRQLANGS